MVLWAWMADCATSAASAEEPLAAGPLVIGHRGAAGLAPENTLAGIRRALETGVDAVEVDLLMTDDGALVVHHDFALNPEIARTATGSWIEGASARLIRELTLAEVKSYDVGRLKPGTNYAHRYPDQRPADGEKIPSLQEVIKLLKAVAGPQVELWIEVKSSPAHPQWTPAPVVMADALVALLTAERFGHRCRVLSFDWRVLVRVQAVAPALPTLYLTSRHNRFKPVSTPRGKRFLWTAGLDLKQFDGSIARMIAAAGGRHWGARYNQITPIVMAEARREGISVFVWTVDSPSDMREYREMGVDGIITNRPDLLRSVLRSPDD
jgi:glycerophosphoryl diester phosphodiesterase